MLHNSTSDINITQSAENNLPTTTPLPKGLSIYKRATECVLVDSSSLQDPYKSSSTPLYLTATFKQEKASEQGEYDYTRSGNPTRTQLELHLAKIMRAKKAFALSSGMTALDILLRMVKTGQEIIAGNDLYGGTHRLLSFYSSQQSIPCYFVDTTQLLELKKKLSSRTRLVLLESPTNPLMKVCDIPAVCQLVHSVCPEALVIVDNTMASLFLYIYIYIFNLYRCHRF
jgi:cystathionine beta-lyase